MKSIYKLYSSMADKCIYQGGILGRLMFFFGTSFICGIAWLVPMFIISLIDTPSVMLIAQAVGVGLAASIFPLIILWKEF